jgi:hypothetical protein
MAHAKKQGAIHRMITYVIDEAWAPRNFAKLRAWASDWGPLRLTIVCDKARIDECRNKPKTITKYIKVNA